MLLKYLVSLPSLLIEGSASYFSLSYCPTGDASRGGVKRALSCKIGLAVIDIHYKIEDYSLLKGISFRNTGQCQ